MITHDAVSACAPGRVELLGNHTDYNEGVVLGAAINRVICVSGTRDDRAIRIRSGGFGEVETDVANLRPLGDARWANYILGVAAELRQLDVPISGFVADVRGDLPIGSGLSSSAALELATALLLLKLFPFELPRLEIAKACQRGASLRRCSVRVARPGHFAVWSRAARRLLRLSHRRHSHRSVSFFTSADHCGLRQAARACEWQIQFASN